MDRHESRDLDGVIDEVARAMTGAELARDLRPAVVARIASAPSWTLFGQAWWRAGLAAAGVAAVVLVAVVLRSTPEPQPPQTVVAGGVRAAGTTVASFGGTPAPTAREGHAAAIGRTARTVVRQTIADTPVAAETVDISPVAIVPLEDNEVAAVLAVPQLVEIAPIDVELVSIGELQLVE